MPPDRVLEPILYSVSAHALVFVLGALWGSFANVCIYRWPPDDDHPRGRSVVRPGSRCGACGQPVRWHDNVPILSYFALRGRCRDCGAAFSPRYVLVEAMTAIVFVALYHFAVVAAFPHEPVSVRMLRFVSLAGFAFTLIVIAFIDLDHRLILDRITYPAIPIFYAAGALLPGRGFVSGLIGAVVGYGVIRLIADGYYYLTGREGMGLGDAKLLAVVGAFLGWQGVVATLFVGSLVGSVVSVGALVVTRGVAGGGGGGGGDGAESEGSGDGAESEGGDEGEGRDGGGEGGDAEGGDGDESDVPIRHVEVPFGPFLAMGALVYVFVEPWLQVRLAGL